MAAQEKDVRVDDESAALFKEAMRKFDLAQKQINEGVEFLRAAYEPQRKTRSAIDKNGEPTWDYLVKQKIPADIFVTKEFAAYAAQFGFSQESAEILMNGKGTYEGFKVYYKRVGTKWQCWSLVWKKWVRSEYERKQKASEAKNTGRASRFDQQRTRG